MSERDPANFPVAPAVVCASFLPMKATFAEPEMIVRNGKPVSVILPLKAYEALLERVGDAADVLVSRSRRGGAVETHDEVRRRTVARLKANG